MTYTQTLPIKPKVKGRPRVLKTGHTYTDAKTKAFEAAVAEAYDGPKFEGPVSVSLAFNKDTIDITITETTTESKLRGDIDNYAKAVLDGLNNIAFDDDKQVAHLELEKV